MFLSFKCIEIMTTHLMVQPCHFRNMPKVIKNIWHTGYTSFIMPWHCLLWQRLEIAWMSKGEMLNGLFFSLKRYYTGIKRITFVFCGCMHDEKSKLQSSMWYDSIFELQKLDIYLPPPVPRLLYIPHQNPVGDSSSPITGNYKADVQLVLAAGSWCSALALQP